MKKKTLTRSRFAICIDNAHYPASLELHKVYRLLPDADAAKDGDLRVIDESGEDYLYPADYFVLVELPGPTGRALKKSYARAQ
jgi:hypothetical protein